MLKQGLFILMILLPQWLYASIPGKRLYNQACANCHAPDKASAIKAPPAFDEKTWRNIQKNAALAVKNHQFKTIDDYFLYQVKIGRGLMHHGGLCRETKEAINDIDCDNKDYLAAINYMMRDNKNGR